MDASTLEFMFKQNLNTIIEFTKTMFSTLREEIAELRSENSEIKKSLELTQAELAESKLKLVTERDTFSPSSCAEVSDLSERVRIIEDYNRRKNLIVDGLPEAKSENSEILQKKITSTFEDKFEISPSIASVHRLGSRINPSKGPRPVIVKFNDFEQRQTCFRSSPKLKGTNLYLRGDVCQATLDIRRSKLDELKSRRAEGLIAYFSGIRIITKEKKETSDIDEGSQQTTARKNLRKGAGGGAKSGADRGTGEVETVAGAKPKSRGPGRPPNSSKAK